MIRIGFGMTNISVGFGTDLNFQGDYEGHPYCYWHGRHEGGGDRNHRPGKGEGERPVNRGNVEQPRVEIDRTQETQPKAEVEKPKEQQRKTEVEKPKAEEKTRTEKPKEEEKSKTEKPKPEDKKDDSKPKGE
jgi:sRNA-binding protein